MTLKPIIIKTITSGIELNINQGILLQTNAKITNNNLYNSNAFSVYSIFIMNNLVT